MNINSLIYLMLVLLGIHSGWQEQSLFLSRVGSFLSHEAASDQEAIPHLDCKIRSLETDAKELRKQISEPNRILETESQNGKAESASLFEVIEQKSRDKESKELLEGFSKIQKDLARLQEESRVRKWRFEQLQNILADLELLQENLKLENEIPTVAEGGSYNPQALIPEDFQIPELDTKTKLNTDSESDKDSPEISGNNGSDNKEEQEKIENSVQQAGNVQTDVKDTGGAGESAKSVYLFNQACPADDIQNLLNASSSWVIPVEARISAGTWQYPSGGIHLGLDLAAPLYSDVKAPANGIIVYADNPVETDCGYLGNWCGWPNGGGNTIGMLCVVEDQLYFVAFYHLSSTLFVTNGQQVTQNDIIALSGNSGNSTGPHTHIEITRLSVSYEEAFSKFASTADFSFGCGWSKPAGCSEMGCRIRPEEVFYTGQ